MNKPSLSVSIVVSTIIVGCFLTSSVALSLSPQSGSATEKSYRQARVILESGLQALGGLEAMIGLKNFTVIEKEKHTYLGLPNPDPSYDTSSLEETTIVDFTGRRIFSERRFDKEKIQDRNVINGNEGFYLNLALKRAVPLRSPSFASRPESFRKLPQLLLREILDEHSASLRYLGEAEEEGGTQHVISYVDRNGISVSLYFNKRTGLLTKYEYLYTSNLLGDTLRRHLITGYRKVGPFQVPTRLEVRHGERVSFESIYEKVEFNGQLDERLFAVPADFEKIPPSSYRSPAPYSMTEIAADVYLMNGVAYDAHSILIVAFKDYLMVIESPEAGTYNGKFDTATDQAIAKIKETFPGKPIKYHAFTHYHYDHGGGVRAYIAEGAEIIVTPGNKEFVEKTASAPFIITTDALARKQRDALIVVIKDKKHVVRDETRAVEIYDVGPYPHVKEELVFYLPHAKLLFVGDIYIWGNRDEVWPASDSALLLAEKLKQWGLDVQRIVGVHGRLRPIEDFYRAVDLRLGK
jgi:glyoxylase-like metal-dependent hydrolase (beta-lactamase superfamily II)